MKRLFYLVVALQLLFLLAQAASTQLALRRSPIVTLKVVPVDPRSLFTGQYIALAYDISTIDLSKVTRDAPIEAFVPGDTAYVGLIPEKPWARVCAVRRSPPDRHPNILFLRGHIADEHDGRVEITYGLERYFIPEARQQDVNRLQRGRGDHPPRITAEVSVRGDGQGLIRRVLVDGKALGF